METPTLREQVEAIVHGHYPANNKAAALVDELVNAIENDELYRCENVTEGTLAADVISQFGGYAIIQVTDHPVDDYEISMYQMSRGKVVELLQEKTVRDRKAAILDAMQNGDITDTGGDGQALQDLITGLQNSL